MNFLRHKNSKWVDIGMDCPRCQHPLLHEVFNNGEPTNYFTCRRYGCTWPDFSQNVEKILNGLEQKKEKYENT